MNQLLVFPILIPLLGAAFCLLFWRSRIIQRIIGLISSIILFGATVWLLLSVIQADIMVVQLGNFPAPYGITLVGDLLSAIMVFLGGLMGLSVMIYSLVSMDPKREQFGYYPLLLILLMGVSGAFLTGDIFNLFVWFEVMLIASFVLLALGGERAQLEGSFKYVTINLLSSAIFLAAVGLLYGIAGTLNMADLAIKLSEIPYTGRVTALGMMLMVTFGVKAAIFPLFYWLPASYHTPPAAVSAIFAGLLTKVGVYALIRVFTLLFIQDVSFTHTVILIISGFTMVTGVLGALAQNEFRRILSFHIVSQIGYMIMGLGLFSPLALAGSVFYIIHHIIVKTNLFLVSGLTYRLRGSYELKNLGGMYRSYPVFAVLFLIPALSLAGIPPLSGFFAKLALVQSGLGQEQYLIVGVSLAVSIVTLLSMTKIWNEVFWKEAVVPVGQAESSQGAAGLWVMVLPITVLATLTLLIGFGAGPVFDLSIRAASQLLDPSIYIQAVFGTPP